MQIFLITGLLCELEGSDNSIPRLTPRCKGGLPDGSGHLGGTRALPCRRGPSRNLCAEGLRAEGNGGIIEWKDTVRWRRCTGMKKWAARLVCLLMTLVMFEGLWTTAYAALDVSGYCGDNVQYYYNYNSNSLRIWGTGPMYDATNKFDTPWESIWVTWSGTVQIGAGITHIGSYAFSDFSSLTKVTIPSSVTSIGESAFVDCSGLSSVELPESVTSIGAGAFNGCTMLRSINIPQGVTKIEDWTFFECDFLAEIDLPGGLTSIGEYAFSDTQLTKIVIPNGVTSIGKSAFRNCFYLEQVTIPGSVEVIGHGAFWQCSALESVTIGKGVREIDDYAFHDCKKLTSVTISDTVERIGASAFDSCVNLTTVVIPASVKVIEEDAFGEKYGSGKKLEHVYILGRGDIQITGLFEPFPEGTTIHCYRNTPIASWAERKQKFNDYTIVYLDGDADMNGKINLQDVLLIMQYAAGWSVVIDDSADMDASGTIDVQDAILLLESL
ncbi:MAG: hypothetical protein E7318_06545 [Clostridiales bacterium]|nr:hypothetical protein [Clostridiales bacterium]